MDGDPQLHRALGRAVIWDSSSDCAGTKQSFHPSGKLGYYVCESEGVSS
jgi:hypothetical protein